MGKRRKLSNNGLQGELFARPERRPRSGLILGRLLAAEADKLIYRGPQEDRAYKIITHWANLERNGHLQKKETALDAGFLHEVFSQALGYREATQDPKDYHLERNFTVPGVGTADGALGNFTSGEPLSPLVVIELKGADSDLDRDRFNGRTPVQQCWDYLNALPNCPWGIVSNFITFRLYHRNKTPLAYEHFRLQDLREIKRFRQFYCLFERGGLVTAPPEQCPRALRLLKDTENRQREVGDELYSAYSENRLLLIQHLQFKLGKTLDQAIAIAQKILDRIVFVAFCEDRGLLPPKSLETAYSSLPPFSKVTNPRWQNFLQLFRGVDEGPPRIDYVERGYDGLLFRHDPEVDDLQLDDEWTHFFKQIGTYDFRDEVNVDVLGHLFERSVSELERIRQGGLFGVAGARPETEGPEPAMQKSAERKRFGIFYTPAEFTDFVVRQTVEKVVEERLEQVRQSHGLKPEEADSDQPSGSLAAYWRDCLAALRTIKVCDPACGSGAFLIRAYDALEPIYTKVAERLSFHEGKPAEDMEEAVPAAILAENLYGVDVYPPAVEITQLALWLRSARRHKSLADLSRNVVCGNSLVTDPDAHPSAMVWQERFPEVFARADHPGFDCVIGNPPWERLKLQEREFFAFSAPEIAGAVSAATRRRLIQGLDEKNPELYARYLEAQGLAEKTLVHVRESGNFPLTAKGDINTYMLFAELARRIVAPQGRVGLLVPSGIATDNTTREFFAELMGSKSLISLHDFENKAPVFPDVHRSFKFCTLVFGGAGRKSPAADFVFFARRMEDLDDRKRHIPLSSKDIALLNPNTRTCPVFRSRRDAELTKAIYRRVPILIDESRKQGGNPWGIKYLTMFHQTNDAELFRTGEELSKQGFKLEGNVWRKGKRHFLPLYEAKMVQAYDHRAASVLLDTQNWVRQGQPERTTLVSHQNPEFVAQPRWWVEEADVEKALGNRARPAYLCYKDVTSPTNQRTMIAAMIPHVAVVNSAPLVLTAERICPQRVECLLANLNSFALDYVARQKVGGVHLNFFIVNQLPIFPPDRYDERCPWRKSQTLEKWISDRVLKLTCTAEDMRPLAEAAGFDPPVHKWNPSERSELMAELDAAFFLLYGLNRDDAEYILSTFQGLRRGDEEEGGLFVSEGGILEAYDRLAGSA
jgi:hypothetical protein